MDIDLDVVNKLFNFGGTANQITKEHIFEAGEDIITKQKPAEQKRNQKDNQFPAFESKRKSAQCKKSDEVSAKDETSDEMLLLSTFGGMIQCKEKDDEDRISAVPSGLDSVNTKSRANAKKRAVRFRSKVIILGRDMEKKKGRKKKARAKSKPLRSILKKKDNLVSSSRKPACEKQSCSPVGQTTEQSCIFEFHFGANGEEGISVIEKQSDTKRKIETQEVDNRKKLKISESEPVSEHIDRMINSAIEAMTGVHSKEEAGNDDFQNCVTASMIEPLQSTIGVQGTCNNDLVIGPNGKSGGQIGDFPVLSPIDSFSDVGACLDDSCDLAIDCDDHVHAANADMDNAVTCNAKNWPSNDSKVLKSHLCSQLSEMKKDGHNIMDLTTSIVPKDSICKTDTANEKSFDVLSTNSESDFESDEEIALAGLIKKIKDEPTNKKLKDHVRDEQEVAEVLANIHATEVPTDSSKYPVANLGPAELRKVSSNKQHNLPCKPGRKPNQEGTRKGSLSEKCCKEKELVSEKAVPLKAEADLLNRCQEIAGNPQQQTVTRIGELNEKIMNMNKSPNSWSSRALAVSSKSKQPLKSNSKSPIGLCKMENECKKTPAANGIISQGKSPTDVNNQLKLGIKLSSKSTGVVCKESANSLPLPVQEEIRKSLMNFVNVKAIGNASTLDSVVKTQETSAAKMQQRSAMTVQERSADNITQTVKLDASSLSSSAISDKGPRQFPTIGHDAEVFQALEFDNIDPEKAIIASFPYLLNGKQKYANVPLSACDNRYHLDRQPFVRSDIGSKSIRQDQGVMYNRDDDHAYTRPYASSLGEQCSVANHGALLRNIQRQLSQLQQQVDALQRNYDAMRGDKQNAKSMQAQTKSPEPVQIDPDLNQICQQLVSAHKGVLSLKGNPQSTQINAIRGARMDDKGSSGMTTDGTAFAALNGPLKKNNITLRIVVEKNGSKCGNVDKKCSK